MEPEKQPIDPNPQPTAEPTKKCKHTAMIIILAILAIGGIGFGGYELWQNIQKDNEIKNLQAEDNKVKEKVSIISSAVKKAMSAYDSIYITRDELYGSNMYSISNISGHDLIATAIMNIDQNLIAYCVSDPSGLKDVISFQALNDGLNKYILDKNITHDTIETIKKGSSFSLAQYQVNYGVGYGIILEDEGVKVIGGCGSEFDGEDFVNKKIVDSEKDANRLYVYEKQAFGKYIFEDENGNILANYYKKYNNEEQPVEEKKKSPEFGSYSSLADDPNWELYDTYKYTFKIVNDEYYFESFGLANE